MALSALLSVVRGQPSPTAQPAVEMITEVWLRMSPAQVRTKTHSDYSDESWSVISAASWPQVQSCPVLQDTLQLLLSVTAALVKNAEPHVLCQVNLFPVMLNWWVVAVKADCCYFRRCHVWTPWFLGRVRIICCWLLWTSFPPWGRSLFLRKVR